MANYRHLEIEDALGEPTSEELKFIEEKLGAKLPAEFIDFLRAANGGYLSYSIDVPMEEDGKVETLSFCELYGTRSKSGHLTDESTFLAEIDSERKYKSVPTQVLPIARDGGSSILYLDLTPKGAGRVVAFVDGLPAWTGLRQNAALIELSKTFTEFIDKLYFEPNE